MTKLLIDSTEVYTLDEAAAELHKGIATIFRWIKRGKINRLKIGNHTLIPRSEIERLKKEKESVNEPSRS